MAATVNSAFEEFNKNVVNLDPDRTDCYLMEQLKYRKSLVRLTEDNVITTRRNS